MKLLGPLRNRIMALTVGGVLVLLAAVFLLVDMLWAAEAHAGLLREAGLVADTIVSQVTGRLEAGNLAGLEKLAQGITARGRVLAVVLLDRDRRVLLAEPPETASIQSLTVWPKNEAAEDFTLEVRSLPAIARFQPVVAQTAVVGGVWLALDRQPQVAAARRFHTLALLIIVALTGLSMVLATMFAEAVVRPLDELGDIVSALGHGELTTRHNLQGSKEIVRLARRVNQLAETLEAAEAAHQRLAADLENQVRTRTRELEDQSRRFSQMANTDPLTGLTNRRGLEIELDRYLSLSRRNRQPLAVIMMDLDNFKTYNDRCGHLSGDTVLKAVSAALRARARTSDVVARWGGDEFCILIPATDPQGALAATQRFVLAVLEAMGDLSRADVSAVLGASAGLACFPEDGEEAAELVARADAALYRVKASGGSGVMRALSAWTDD